MSKIEDKLIRTFNVPLYNLGEMCEWILLFQPKVVVVVVVVVVVWFNVPLDTFYVISEFFFGGGVTAVSARIIAVASPTVCAVLSSVCATTVDNSGVYVYCLNGIVSVCFRCPSMGFSGTRLYLCTSNQA